MLRAAAVTIDKQMLYYQITVVEQAADPGVRKTQVAAGAEYYPALAALQVVAFHGVLVGRPVMPELVITQPLVFLVTSGPEAAVDGALLEETG
jgi:hypothetical protein